MSSLNKVFLIGHLGRDAETKFTPSGKSVTSFSLATSYKSKEKEETEWHNIEAWNKEKISEYLLKGKCVHIEGRIKTDVYDGNDGTKKYRTKVVAENILLLTAKGQGDAAPRQASLTDEDVPF